MKIQQEHGQAMLELAEGTPVVGHITAGVYAATGDLKKAEEVAIEATKSTVVAAAGIAGIAMVSNPVQTMVVVKAATEILEPFSALGSPRN